MSSDRAAASGSVDPFAVAYDYPLSTRDNITLLRQFLNADMVAHGVRRWSPDLRYRNPQLHYQRILRMVEFLQRQPGPIWRVLRVYFRFRLHKVSVATGLSIPPGVFGPGLSIAHYGSIVVNSQARVGSFCRIHSATNIGVAGGGTPTIGDRVYIAPGAVLFGNITIGDNVVVGANAVVNRSFRSGVTVAGAPAKVIAEQGSEDVMPEWYPPVSAAEAAEE